LQPRHDFDDEALSELSASIATLGVIQPITLRRRNDGKYTIISG
jgi:ParB family chromosome partitioning protein